MCKQLIVESFAIDSERQWVDSILKEAYSKSGKALRVQYAFEDSMIHLALRFALRIAVCCVLHRDENRDIHC